MQFRRGNFRSVILNTRFGISSLSISEAAELEAVNCDFKLLKVLGIFDTETAEEWITK